MADDDIILADLSDEELVQQMHDDLYDGLKEEIEEGRALYKSRVTPELYGANFYDRALVDLL
ncbi:MAG: hypothetical protein RIR97_1192, partial [Pseudomonadota bacterium]